MITIPTQKVNNIFIWCDHQPRPGGPVKIRPTRFFFGFDLIWFNIISAPGKSFVCLLRFPISKKGMSLLNTTFALQINQKTYLIVCLQKMEMRKALLDANSTEHSKK